MKEEATLKTIKDNMSGEKNYNFNFKTVTPNKLSDKFSKPGILILSFNLKISCKKILIITEKRKVVNYG